MLEFIYNSYLNYRFPIDLVKKFFFTLENISNLNLTLHSMEMSLNLLDNFQKNSPINQKQLIQIHFFHNWIILVHRLISNLWLDHAKFLNLKNLMLKISPAPKFLLIKFF